LKRSRISGLRNRIWYMRSVTAVPRVSSAGTVIFTRSMVVSLRAVAMGCLR
jgi:hypothetical protein